MSSSSESSNILKYISSSSSSSSYSDLEDNEENLRGNDVILISPKREKIELKMIFSESYNNENENANYS